MKKRSRWCLVALCSSGLIGCGGGGSAADPAPPNNTVLAATVSAHAATPGTAAAGNAADLTAEPPAHGLPTSYTIVKLGSGDTSEFPVINSHNQVAFSLFGPSGSRAGFFDGATVHDLGTLGGTQAFATALNESGQVAGYSDIAGGLFHPFRWSLATGMLDLGTLNGAPSSYGRGINGPGQVVGYNEPPLAPPQAFFWSDTTGMVDIGRLGAGGAVAQAINDAGTVTGYSDAPDGNTHAFAWNAATGIVDLGTVGGIDSYGTLINKEGEIAGYSAVSDLNGFNYHGFVWNPSTGIVDIGTLSGLGSAALAMNATGQVAGVSDKTALYQHAILWTRAGGLVDLGTLGGPMSRALGINNNGVIVGTSTPSASLAEFHAFVWTKVQGMIDLNTRLKHAPPGLVLTDAVAISDSGAIVADSNAGLVLLKPSAHHHGPAAPVVGPIMPSTPVAVGKRIAFSAGFTDQNRADTHKAAWSWGDRCGSSNGTVTESNGAGTVRGQHSFCKPGVYPVTVTVTDNTGRSSTAARDVVVYDPSAATVAGAGWFVSPQGAYGKNKVHAGRAAFSFVSKLTNDPTPRQRDMTLRFNVAGLHFQSASYDSLSVAGTRAQYQGSGTINGTGNYKFLMTAVDGSGDKPAGQSRLRMKIWHIDARSNAEVVDYDNQVRTSASSRAAASEASEGSVIAAGSIAIRK